MNNYYRSFVILLLSLFFASNILANRVVVDTDSTLVAEVTTLSDGDTLYIAEGTYHLNDSIAPFGVFVATLETWAAYTDVVVMGAGVDKTIIDCGGDYGFFIYHGVNILVRDLTVTNAKINGGFHVQYGELNLENVFVHNCYSASSTTKVEGNGGAVYYDFGSKFKYIKNCVFENNAAEHHGGALALENSENTTDTTAMLLEYCRVSNNSAGGKGAAVYMANADGQFTMKKTAVYANTGGVAVAIDTDQKLDFVSNTVAKNDALGISIGANNAGFCTLNSNVFVDNDSLDFAGKGAVVKGNYNLIGRGDSVSFGGLFNKDLPKDSDLFVVQNDTLKHTIKGASYLAGRLPNSYSNGTGVYGDTVHFPGDIGAVNVSMGRQVAVWTGLQGHDFYDTGNWKNGVNPNEGVGLSQVKKVIISNSSENSYPIISVDVSGLIRPSLQNTDFIISPTGILQNQTQLQIDSFCIESQRGGTGQFTDQDSLLYSHGVSEFYLPADKWTALHIPDTTMKMSDLMPDLVWGTDYVVKQFDERLQAQGKESFVALVNDEVFDNKAVYWVKSEVDQVISFAISRGYQEQFALQRTESDSKYTGGWNWVPNPYEATISIVDVLANAGNEVVAGAAYVYDGMALRVLVDSVGDDAATQVLPHQGFLVNLWPGPDSVDVPFVLNVNDVDLFPDVMPAASYNNDEGLVTITVVDSKGREDNAYLSLSSDATNSFDATFDALELNRINGSTMPSISTMIEDTLRGAVNTLDTIDEPFLSVPLCVDYVSSAMGGTSRLLFDIQGSDSLSYLLHDSQVDSSRSIALVSGASKSFRAGSNREALQNRFSFQIFEGPIPDSVMFYNSYRRDGLELKPTYTYDITVVKDTLAPIFLKDDTLWHNPDTIFVENYYVDSVYVYTSKLQVVHMDSVILDSLIVDTTRVWGTYDYINTFYDVARTTHKYDYDGTTTHSFAVEYYNYILMDTLDPMAIGEVYRAPAFVSISTSAHTISLNAVQKSPLDVSVYSLSGMLLRSVTLPLGGGMVTDLDQGVYIVKVRQGDREMASKVMVPN